MSLVLQAGQFATLTKSNILLTPIVYFLHTPIILTGGNYDRLLLLYISDGGLEDQRL